MKFFLALLCFTNALFSAPFQEEFLDEVLNFSSSNPIEIRDQEEIFLKRFYECSMQSSTRNDEELRPIYVSAQGDFEKTMAYLLQRGKISELIGWIHTPTPATPLCTENTITLGLVDESMENDPMRLYTVMKRPEIIRGFLRMGGILYAVYPEGGLSKRSKEQLAIFNELKDQYPDHLIDVPLPIASMPSDMVGATYLFKGEDEEMYGFAIQAPQANAPEDDRKWAMWFGPLSDLEVGARVSKVQKWMILSK